MAMGCGVIADPGGRAIIALMPDSMKSWCGRRPTKHRLQN